MNPGGKNTAASARVHIVVLNWNGLEDTLACLASLEQVSFADRLTVVVDNGSAQSPRVRIEREYPAVELIENPRNLGYSGGNNVALRRALATEAEFVWVLNNDTTVEPDALDELLSTAERYPRAAAVGGKVLRADRPGVLWMAWGRVTWRQSLIALEGQDAADEVRYDVERPVEWIPGCSILFRTRALREIGLFDEGFFAYHEDVDWAARAHRAGWELWYNGRSVIRHAIHASSGGESASYRGFRSYLSARNSVLYARRYGRPWQQLAMTVAILANLPFQFVRRLLRGELAGVVMKLRGWRDGLFDRPVPFAELGLEDERDELPET